MSNEKPRFLVICRAAAKSPDGANAEARIGTISRPTDDDLDEWRAAITRMFEDSFGKKPRRVGVAVLPWVDEIDDPEPGDA